MKAIIVNAGTEFIDDVRSELLDWARGLGLDTRVATATFVLIEDSDGWRAHFSIKRQRDGHDYVQPGTNRIATDYGSHIVEVGSWPAWFPEPDEVPYVAASDLLELLAVADDAASQIRSAWHSRRRVEEPLEPPPSRFAQGGIVRGPSSAISDSIPTCVTPGEQIVYPNRAQ